MKTTDRLLTVRELCRYAQVNRKLVYASVKSGRLRALRLGSRLRFAPRDVSRWLDSTTGRR